ncbi:MAG: hypothetical protein HY023_00595 [Chloroflexi bacterium]|nr:hypothetical protein [Chloroflexota bacterium]
MTDSKRLTGDKTTMGDAAVDGLIAGIGAGVLMAAVLIVAGLLVGDGPGVVLGRFDPGAAASPVTGGLMHLAVSGVYGALFGLGRRLMSGWPPLSRLPGWLIGLAYGLLLWAVAQALLPPGTESPLRELPALHFALAHAAFGLTLGLALPRK